MASDSQSAGSPPDAAASWAACPPGAVRRVASALRAKRSWAAYAQAVITVGVLLVAGTGLWFAVDHYIYGGFEPTHAYGLTCNDVLSGLPDYLAGQLDGDEVAQFEWHLERCRRCYERYRELGGDKVFAAAAGPDLRNASFAPPGDPSAVSSCGKPCCGSSP